MNSALRQRLRQEIDAITRRNVVATRGVGCAGCGSHLDSYVSGCRQCKQRQRKRERGTADHARQTA